ncbi:uncharacterized protein [Spinacia oleracea]|nr:uncharacterized protein LOC110799608 isoform X2 [Spinacia oleracea]
MTLCNKAQKDLLGNKCSGIGCCMGFIPDSVNNISIEAKSYHNHQNVLDFNPCSVAFLVANDAMPSSLGDFLTHNATYFKNLRLPVAHHWTVGTKDCEAAKSSGEFICKRNSACRNLSYQRGYHCQCNPGFQGNPYLHDCQDIDECTQGNHNFCKEPAYCVNTVGSYECLCPQGYIGNGTANYPCILDPNSAHRSQYKLLVGLSVTLGSVLSFLVGLWLYSVIKRRQAVRQRAKHFQRNGGLLLQQEVSTDEVVARMKIFTIVELEKATDHFNEDRILGQGGRGTVYKGMLGEGRIVAIKKSKIVEGENQVTEFINEMVILSRINHRNIVKLLGCCLETEVPLLVYEFIPNGTLFRHIHNPCEEFPITWKLRLQIASDSAGALAYLHSSSSIPIFHRDIKSSNILLDDMYRAKLSDFGTSRFVAINRTHVTTRVMGTFGYLDPEYFRSSQFTEKSDVYSFGVVLVELLTGQKAIRATLEDLEQDRSLASWFVTHMENSSLLDIVDSHILQEASKEEFHTIANLALRCLNLDGKRRPGMKEVLLEIEMVLSLHLPQMVEPKKQEFEQVFTGTMKSSHYDCISSSCTFSLEVFGGSGDDAAKYQRAGCIAMCNNRAEPVAGSCPGLGCCQTSLPLGWNWQGFSITLFSVEDGQLTTIGKSLSDQSCSYAFYAKSGSFIFGGASDLVTNNTDDVRNRIMEQVPMVLDWNVQLKISCNQVKINSTSNPYLCQSNTKCVDTAEGGYRCSCLPGYEGNPYLQPGCTDINECVSGPNNPCYMTCVNTPGSYKCSCARGYVGDGLKSGTRCIFVNKRAANLIRITLGLGSSLGVIVLLLVAWWFSTIIKRRKIMKQKVKYFKQNGGLLLQEQMATDDSVVAAIKMFTIDELEKATDHFNQDRILGRGGQGTVYKGMLSTGRIVAIKLCKVVDEVGDFVNEVLILSKINHRSIVKLLGCCLENEAPLQVFEFIPNGTLDHHIHSPSAEFQITWKMRLQIASDTAGALTYLHSSSSIPIFHRDIKSSNILLDDTYRAKLSDFGTSKTVGIDQTHVTTPQVMGTFGYMDPEYHLLGQYTEKSDVYSFGVVLVELLTGQKAVRSALEEEKSLASWFLSHMKNPRLLDIIDSRVLQEDSKEEFLIIAEIAEKCLNQDRNSRPTMKEVLLEIEAVLSLHLPQANEQNWPKSEQIFSGSISDGVVSSSTAFYLENSSLSSAEVSLLFNSR